MPQAKALFEQACAHLVEGITLEKVVFAAFECLLSHGSASLELTEEKNMKMEKRLINGKKSKELNKVIFELKWHLMLQKNYYSQLIDIGQELEENENGIFMGKNLRYFRMLTERAERLNEGIHSLGESLIHLREALDASLEYELNSIMKMFTVVTTIFLPLTLIVGWYGMNFKNMPELSWKYGYAGVAVLSIVVIIGCLIMFKRKKLI